MKKSIEDQRKWKNDYNNGFLGFPGGMIDWAAYGFMLVIFYTPIIISIILFDMETKIFESKFRLYTLFIGIAVFCYYWIYFRNIDWLKKRINKINKKYYLK